MTPREYKALGWLRLGRDGKKEPRGCALKAELYSRFQPPLYKQPRTTERSLKNKILDVASPRSPGSLDILLLPSMSSLDNVEQVHVAMDVFYEMVSAAFTLLWL
jgi:hypothetical protein